MKQLLRKILPYSVKTKIRHAIEETQVWRTYAAYHFGNLTRLTDPLMPPPWTHSVGNGDYRKTGDEFMEHFVKVAGLLPTEKVLDIGCGTGRMARPLTNYLSTGTYDGADIVKPSIEWCQRAFTRRYPSFQFAFSDVHNKYYNPEGKILASEYKFPYQSSSFDFVFLTSVFTHMLPKDLENYLSEVSRVLKPGGRCLITYFFLNGQSSQLIEQGAAQFSFQYEYPGCRVQVKDLPEHVVAYDEEKIRSLYEEHGLQISEPIYYGSWPGRKDFLSFQDLILAWKR